MNRLNSVLFAIFMPVTAFGLAPLFILWYFGLIVSAHSPMLACIGSGTLLAGALVFLKVEWDILVHGRGTPSLHVPPKFLASSGIHALSRNPMHIGVALVLVGEALAAQSASLLIYAVSALIVIYGDVVYYEEPQLLKIFGLAYLLYCSRVPRWLPSLKQILSHSAKSARH